MNIKKILVIFLASFFVSYSALASGECFEKTSRAIFNFNMGFDKANYSESESTKTGIRFSAMSDTSSSKIDTWLLPNRMTSPTGVVVKSYYYISPFPILILGEDTIYMELEKYNSMDELLPYSPVEANLLKDANCVCTSQMSNIFTESSNKMCSLMKCPKCQVCPTPYSNVGGNVNSAFAKIPISLSPTTPSGVNYQVVAVKGEIQNVTSFSPPLDTLSKLKIRFRFHDGRLVEFGK